MNRLRSHWKATAADVAMQPLDVKQSQQKMVKDEVLFKRVHDPDRALRDAFEQSERRKREVNDDVVA